MKYSKKQEVAKAWAVGQARKSGSFQTDGKKLFSYDLVIGETQGLTKVLFDYTKGGLRFRSSSTSTHVNTAKPFADVVK